MVNHCGTVELKTERLVLRIQRQLKLLFHSFSMKLDIEKLLLAAMLKMLVL
jgi:hypothetical protein